jgi:superfamily II DNA or RNA helicase
MELLTNSPKGRGKILPPPFVPYDYQAPIIKKMVDRVLQRKNGLIIQPTATGKSVEAAFTARTLALFHNKKGLYLYDENEGLNQARLRFEEIFNGNPIVCANFFGYGKDDHVMESDMVFASFQSLNNHHGKSYLRFEQNHFDYIIVNEAHHGQAITYKEVLNYFQCPKIGMTATPERMDGRDIMEIFDEVIHEMKLEQAIVKAWIAQIEYHIMSHGLSTQKLKKICHEVLEEGKRISVKQLNETIFIEALDSEVKQEIYRYAFPVAGKPRQTLIFCENIDHADYFLKQLQEDNVLVDCVHSRRTPAKNRNIMEKFRKGEIQFLLSVDKLNEDIDVPNVELGIFLRATDSLTVFLQQMGRLLRKTRTKHKAIVLDFVANAERIILIQGMIKRIREASEDIGLPVLEEPLHLTGEGYDFSFTEEIADTLNLIRALEKGYYPTWQEASEAAIALGIRGSNDYLIKRKYLKDLRLPGSPDSFYTDFPGWPTFLKYKMPKPGWISITTLIKKYKAAGETIKKFVSQFTTEHPEWVEVCYSGGAKWVPYYHPDLQNKIEEMFGEHARPPEGWMTAHVVGGDQLNLVKKIAERYRKDHPEWFKLFRTIYKGYIEHYHPELVKLILDFLPKKSERQPGWLSLTEVMELTKKTKSVILRILSDLRDEYRVQILPLTRIGLPTEQYHPDLVEKIKTKLAEEVLAPEGWETTTSLRKKKDLVVSFEGIIAFVGKFRESNPEWFQQFHVISIGFVEHYHPDLVQKMYEEFGIEKRAKAPDGWRTPNKLGRDPSIVAKAATVKKFAELFRQDHPEWFRVFWAESSFFEHYHPELIKKIKETFVGRERTPDGWYTKKVLASQLGRKRQNVGNVAERFRASHPEWFKFYLTVTGNRYVEHYHPELVKKISEFFSK